MSYVNKYTKLCYSMHINIIFILLLIVLPHRYEFLFQANYKKMMGKAKAYYKTKFGKDKTWHFLQHDLSEYPGTNEKYKEMNKKKWDEYYECLKIQNGNLGTHQSVTPEAVQGFEGGSVSFDCKICLRQKELSKIDSVEWHWAPLENQYLIPVEYTEHILLSPEDKTLTLYNLAQSQTGQYMCKLGGSLTAPYFLTVANSSINISEVHTEFAAEGPYPKKPEPIPQYSLALDTVWGEWSPCSKCGNVGKRHKFGYCVVYMENQEATLRSRKNSTNGTVSNNYTTMEPQVELPTTTTIPAEHFTQQNTKINKEAANDTLLRKNLELLKIFKYGVPCLSHILPDSIKNLFQIKNRSNEIMIGYCKVSCAEEEVFEVRDKDGNVIERANNSAGIYSMLQGMPPVEPPVARMLQYERLGEHIVVSCPGNLNSNTPIQWQAGSKKLVPELIVQQSKGRIYISVMDKINIKKAKVSDSNTYSCWQNNDLAGTVRLVVEKKIRLTFNHHIMLFGMVFILAIFLYVFTKAFFGRKYAFIKK